MLSNELICSAQSGEKWLFLITTKAKRAREGKKKVSAVLHKLWPTAKFLHLRGLSDYIKPRDVLLKCRQLIALWAKARRLPLHVDILIFHLW